MRDRGGGLSLTSSPAPRRPCEPAEESHAQGDAYYVPPGHTPVHHAGTTIVEFSPTDVLRQTMPVVMDNLRAAQAGV